MKTLLIVFLTFFVFVFPVSAHPGNTAADGCHYCRTNCDKWGVAWNERHCHGGGAEAPVQQEQPVYVPPTNIPYVPPANTSVPTRKPTNTPNPTRTPTLTKKLSPTRKITQKVIKKAVKKTPTLSPKKSFWQKIFNE